LNISYVIQLLEITFNLTKTSLYGAEIQIFQPLGYQVQVSPGGIVNYQICLLLGDGPCFSRFNGWFPCQGNAGYVAQRISVKGFASECACALYSSQLVI
jgi:hypothetical protein